jgi:hypothetical protein
MRAHLALLLLQATDGNLVVGGSKGALLWVTRMTSVPPGPYTLELTEEGVLRLAANGTVYWTSGELHLHPRARYGMRLALA